MDSLDLLRRETISRHHSVEGEQRIGLLHSLFMRRFGRMFLPREETVLWVRRKRYVQLWT